MGQVQDKIALVTGAASGIGAACARLMAAEGARVIVADVDDARGQAVVAEIAAAGGKARYARLDVTQEDDWVRVISEIARDHGRLDALVANAGVGIAAPVVEMTLNDFRKQNAINLDGVFLSCKHGIPLMRKSGAGGSIVLMSSVAGLRGAAGLAGYCATKGGVRFFGKAVALECAAAGDKIRVNTVHPGIIDTPIWGKIPLDAETSRANAPMDPHAIAHRTVPLERSGTADDIARGVLWLASDASSYVTGSELVIDGGMMAGAFFRMD